MNIKNLNEQQLIELLSSPDKNNRWLALYELLNRFARFIMFVANRYYQLNEQDLPDFTANLFESLIKGKQAKNINEFKNYLSACVRNKSIDRLRSKQPKLNYMPEDELSNFIDKDPLINDSPFVKEILDSLAKYLTTDKEKAVFNYWREGLANEQIARKINVEDTRTVELIKYRIKRKVISNLNKK